MTNIVKLPKYECSQLFSFNYNDVIMSALASQNTSFMFVYSTVYSGSDQRKHQISALLAFVRGIHRCPLNSPHKGPVMRKMFPFDDVIICNDSQQWHNHLVRQKSFLLCNVWTLWLWYCVRTTEMGIVQSIVKVLLTCKMYLNVMPMSIHEMIGHFTQ